MTYELKVPLALDDEGRYWNPDEADQGEDYFCPECGNNLTLRKGQIKTPHFAHQPDTTCTGTGESILHKTAKGLIVQVVGDWKSGKIDAPIIRKKCDNHKYYCDDFIDVFLPDKVESAVAEYALDRYRVDVAFMDANKEPIAAVEIKVTHAVDEKKASSLPIPFIELDGQKVIDTPYIWEPISEKDWRYPRCKACEERKEEYKDAVKRVSKQTNVVLPSNSYYKAMICECWKCKKDILVFSWPKTRWEQYKPPKVKPVPRTIQYRFSKTISSYYWVNTCPYCKNIQGDWFLPSYDNWPNILVQAHEFAYTQFKKISYDH